MRSFVILFLVMLSLVLLGEDSVKDAVIAFKPVADAYRETAHNGDDPMLTGKGDCFKVFGTIDFPGFSIENDRQLEIRDAANQIIPFYIEKDSTSSDFDDEECIDSVKVMFVIAGDKLKQGNPRLVWGQGVDASPGYVENLILYKNDFSKYRSFSVELQPQGDRGGAYYATIDVIVDDYADTYYIWYLLPIGLIFGLLIIRKVALKWS